MLRHRVFIAVVVAELLTLGALMLHLSRQASEMTQHEGPALRTLVSRLGLTDLALWTEARYTRHPSQADRFAPFQDLPASLEHFPAGSVVAAQQPEEH